MREAENLSTGVKPQALLVAGMHRSGTSALTKVLSLLGADLPSNMIPPMQGVNELGFWESSDLVDLHEALLRSAGSSWADWSEFNPSWYGTGEASRFKQLLLNYLHQDFQGSSLFVIKEPRICRFLPLWTEVLDEFDVDLVVIIPVRHPLEVAKSLAQRDGMPLEKGMLIWLRYILDVVYYSQGKKRAFVSYEGLLSNWKEQILTLSQQAGVVFPRMSPTVDIQIESYVNTDHRHFTESTGGLSEEQGGGLVRECYELLKVLLAQEEGMEDALSKLIVVRKEFNRTSGLYARLFLHEEARHSTLKQKLNYAQSQYERCRKELSKAQQGLSKTQQELSKTQQELNNIQEKWNVDKELLVQLREKGMRSIVTLQAYLAERDVTKDAFALSLKQQVLTSDNKAYFADSDLVMAVQRSISGKNKKKQRARAKLLDTILASGLFDEGYYNLACPDAAVYPDGVVGHYVDVGAALGIDPSPLFSTSWYLLNNQDLKGAVSNLLLHFIEHGHIEKRSPHPLFDLTWYLSVNPDVAESGQNPLVHYLKQGAFEGRNPTPLFDSAWYIEHYAIPANQNPLLHFMACAKEVLQRPHPLFWTDYFCETYPLVKQSGLNPLEFYVRYGSEWHYSPNPLFDSQYYCQQLNSDLQGGLTLFAHFLWKGASEGLSPSVWFDIPWYFKSYPQIKQIGINPLLHYLNPGSGQGYQPNPLFKPAWYRGRYIELLEGREPLVDYVLTGFREGRDPMPEFDAKWYVEQDVLLRLGDIDPFKHYLEMGFKEGREICSSELELEKRLYPSQKQLLVSNDGLPEELHVVSEPERPDWHVLGSRVDSETAVIDVVIPVYKGKAETLRCIYSVLRAATATDFCLVVINDASPDELLTRNLQSLAEQGAFFLLENTGNKGFVGTVNRGMTLHNDRDVILLNSDTEVYDGWLDRLVSSAKKNRTAATITPLSNNATICSYPHFLQDNPLPSEADLAQLNELAASTNRGCVVQAPTGVGFCMYIRRDCLDDIGLFDEEAFGKGYGEENDFCQRAEAAGWLNLIATDVFVLHRGATSFQREREERVEQALKVLERRYPDYLSKVDDFIRCDPLAAARERLDWGQLLFAKKQANVLIVSHNRGGGTERHVQEDVSRFQSKGIGVFIMRPEPGLRTHVSISSPALGILPNIPLLALRDSAGIASCWERLGITEVHTHGLVDFEVKAPEYLMAAIHKFKEGAGSLYVEVNIHDYKVICPRLNLTDEFGFYCGEPHEVACNNCLKKRGADFNVGDIIAWRDMHYEALQLADTVSVPDQDVSGRLQRYFPDLVCEVSPHEDFEPPLQSLKYSPMAKDKILRVVVPGAISLHKGYDVLLAVAKEVRNKKLPIDFVLLGYSMDDERLCESGIEVTGKYEEVDALELLVSLKPDIVWLPSLWPETYSYTLSLALQAGLPVMGFDIGAVARRIREVGQGDLLLPLEWAQQPSLIRDFLVKFCQK